MNEDYYKVVVQGGRPIPGQSLTTDPDNPAPYEKPPEYTSVHAASEYIFEKLIDEDNYESLMDLLLEDMPIMEIAQTILFSGFSEGKWNPDLMMMLVEPTAYMILALAERAEIEPVIYRGEEDDEADEEIFKGNIFNKKLLQASIKPTEEIPIEIQEKVDAIPEDSLLTKPDIETNPQSLLAEEIQ